MAKSEAFALFLMYAYYPLRMFKYYSDFVEEQINKEIEGRERILDTNLNGENTMTEEDKKELLENHKYETAKYKEDFINISRSSSIINIYSFAEKQLVMLCDKNTKNKNETFKKNKDKKGVINNAKDYLEKIGIDFLILENEWKLIDDVRLIRNCFAHDAGEVEESNLALIGAINRTPGVSINSSNEIYLEKELADLLNESVNKILDKIYRYTY